MKGLVHRESKKNNDFNPEARPGGTESGLQAGFDALKRGDYERGWPGYEHRLHARQRSPLEALNRPVWRGEPLAGKSILVHREQGVGDEIHYASCWRDLASLGGQCFATCDDRLTPLLVRSFPEIAVLGNKPVAELKDVKTDFQIMSASVLQHFRRSPADFPRHSGYLVADPGDVQHWRDAYARLGPGLKVGISWQGGQDFENLRQAPWRVWRRLLQSVGVHFINLQYGAHQETLFTIEKEFGVKVHDWPRVDNLRDLDQVAAQIKALDLVVTVTNTNAHLAGALGVPLWILFTPKWGAWWILDSFQTPWYPSATVYVNSQGWDHVTQRMGHDLKLLAKRSAV